MNDKEPVEFSLRQTLNDAMSLLAELKYPDAIMPDRCQRHFELLCVRMERKVPELNQEVYDRGIVSRSMIALAELIMSELM